MFLFKEAFTTLQYVGIFIVFAMFLVMVANVAIYGVPEKPKKEVGVQEDKAKSASLELPHQDHHKDKVGSSGQTFLEAPSDEENNLR